MELTFSLMKGGLISPVSVSLLPAMSLYEDLNLKMAVILTAMRLEA